MQEKPYRTWLMSRVGAAETRRDQMSRVRRLELAFGDLDIAFDADGMAGVLRALDYSAADARAGKQLPSRIVSVGKRASVMSTLRHAANLYREFRRSQASIPPNLKPLHMPKAARSKRILQPTGYWMFAANRDSWNVDAWFASGDETLLYTVSPEDAGLMQVGDLGIIKRNVWRTHSSAVMALIEVVEAPMLRSDCDLRFHADAAYAAAVLPRCRLAVIRPLEAPIPIEKLPRLAAFQYLHRGIQRTSTAVHAEAFHHLAALVGLTAADLLGLRGARSSIATRRVEAHAANLTPKAQQRISRYIERGATGAAVKAKRGNLCQVCDALGARPLAFVKRSGEGFSEAHHVMPVAKLEPGSLGAQNIMVLCPNHHRQAHHGWFEIVSEDAKGWIVRVDGTILSIAKTSL
jgi:hypothetical protein